MTLLGIDIGGTKTSVCLGNREGGIQISKRMPSLPEKGFDDYIQRTANLVGELLSEAGTAIESVDAVGISAPGPLSVTKGVLLCPPNMGGWVNAPVPGALAKALGRPVYMNNDANACVLAEWLFGEFKGCANMVYLTMSTGLGAGIIANGHVLQGASDLGGEVGYHVIDPDGPESPCGHRGSFESFCGGKNVADRIRKAVVEKKIATKILEKADGSPERIDFRALVEAVREKDEYALDVWANYVEHLAQGIGNLIMILNPEVIVLGTIAIHAGDILHEPLLAAIPKYVVKEAWDACTIAPSSLGSKIGDLSALAVAIEAGGNAY